MSRLRNRSFANNASNPPIAPVSVEGIKEHRKKKSCGCGK